MKDFCVLLAFVVVVAIIVFALWGGPDVFYKCRSCGAAFKSPAWRHGFPGQIDTSECRLCGGRLWRCTKEQSGWIDGAPTFDD